MIDLRLKKSLRPVARRLRLLRFAQWTLIAWVVAAVFGVLLWHQGNTDPAAPPVTGWQVITVGIAGTGLAVLIAMSSGWNIQSLARRVESAFPQLKQRLLTAMSQRPDQTGRFGYLQRVVIDETLAHARTHQWTRAVPQSRIAASSLAIFPAVACAIFVAFQLGWNLPGGVADGSSELREKLVQDGEVLVEPGNAEIERGNSLMVTARFGMRVPREATLVLRTDEEERRLAMKRSLDDPLFAASIDRVDTGITYSIESNVANSDAFQISVFEFPELQRSDAELQFPSYTGLPDKTVEDTLRISAVEGTELTWICQLNKAVERAWLEDESAGAEENLELVADDATVGHYRVSIKLSESRRWRLHLEDAEGRRNKFPPRLIARVVPNNPPELKLASARDVRVSPLEELPLKATVRDDYGIVRAGLGYSIPGKSEGEVLLGDSIDRMDQRELIHQIDFETLEAEPDELLSYYFWAEDLGPDGEIRRTSGDMFFAEVRPFEEIFREGQSPPGGAQESPPSQQAEDAEQLAELQKQVVIASWALVRRELRKEGSDAFLDDVDAIAEAQTTAKEMLAELAGELNDPQSIEFAGAADDLMDEVLEQLAKAERENQTAPMEDALSSAQAAYQALLRLRDREFQVVRSQQSQSSSSSSSASQRQMQQQLDQLELKNDQNRYEAEQQAQANEEDPQQEAMRQILSRLSELARRQEDLNKQIQELQSALQAAESEDEKEEIARLLKRLREQQQELLRDTDELSQRMQESASDSNALQEARQQLEQTRENVRQASEALDQEDASQALNAGTRAEREFNEMRESVRQETSGQFNDAMREMRQEARDLESQQQSLAEQMRQEEETPDVSQGLRGSPEREETKEAMAEQTEKLKNLLQQMQDTIERSEEIEPLLAEKLYDSFRQAQRDQTEQRLDFTTELLERGLTPQALQMEEEARRGIERLREGVEEAAESVIGDETEGLRRASARLERLAEAVNQEIREATGEPRDPTDAMAENATADQQQASDQSPGQPGDPSGNLTTEQENGPNPAGGGERQASDQQDRPQPQDGQLPDGPPQDGQQPGGPPQDGQQPGDQQTGGQPPNGQPQDEQQAGGQQSGNPSQDEQQPGGQQPSGQPASPSGGSPSGGGARQEGQGSLFDQGNWTDSEGGAPIAAPLTGEGFREWSDAMRDVEQLVEDPELRSEAARIRERARDMRRDWNRHSSEPEWPLVTEMIAKPLERLRMQVSEELIRRSAEKNAVVPIDRDPVPDRFTDAVRDYYERIGSGQ